MKKYLKEYLEMIDSLIKKETINEEDIKNHLIKIGFFQHERLIHLLVTLSYAFFFIIMVVLTMNNPFFVIGLFIIMTILIFYVKHYFFLENGVQYLYRQYDKMKEIIKK